MFVDFLSSNQEKIFLEAVDQKFELMNLNNNNYYYNEKNEDNNFEEKLEKLNGNYYEILFFSDNEKDYSTDDEISEEIKNNNNENEKNIRKLNIKDIINIDKCYIDNFKNNFFNILLSRFQNKFN
jgi:hypothetical protein